MRLLTRIHDERGMALVLALGVLTATAATAAVILVATSASGRHATLDRNGQVAFALAEAGLNNALAALNDGQSPSSQDRLPSCSGAESTWNLNAYEGGNVRWCGTLTMTSTSAYWTIKAAGLARNAVSLEQDLRRLITAKVPLGANATKDNTFQAWNFLFSTRTGDPSGCDMTFSNNVTIGAQVMALGNLCLDQNVVITAPKVIVHGKIYIANNGRIGKSGTNNWSERVETQVGGSGNQYCKYSTNAWTTSSSNPICGDAQQVYSKNADSTQMTVSTTPQSLPVPAPLWDDWYRDAVPGPNAQCTGTGVPTFDNNTTRDNSVPNVFELTPTSSSYTCRFGEASSPIGELSWNHSTKILSVTGTIFFDGSVKMTNTSVNKYVGQATLYISGTFLMDNNAKLCGAVNADGSDCDYANWNPNTNLIAIIVNGDGSQAGAQSQTGSTSQGGNGVKLDNGTRFQGAVQATKNVQLRNNSKVDGPIIADTIVVDNNVAPDSFPTITSVPSGMPGDAPEWAVLNPPQSFAG